MEKVIELPKMLPPDDGVELAIPISSKKIFNIADWKPNLLIQPGTAEVGRWPFFAA